MIGLGLDRRCKGDVGAGIGTEGRGASVCGGCCDFFFSLLVMSAETFARMLKGSPFFLSFALLSSLLEALLVLGGGGMKSPCLGCKGGGPRWNDPPGEFGILMCGVGGDSSWLKEGRVGPRGGGPRLGGGMERSPGGGGR